MRAPAWCAGVIAQISATRCSWARHLLRRIRHHPCDDLLAIILTLRWVGFFGTPWMVWAFARRWFAWKLGEQDRAQPRFENALSDKFEKAMASVHAQLGEDMKPFSEVQTDRVELAG